MHAEGGTAPSLGLPGALGEQADRCVRSGCALSGTDESAKRARLGDVARLSVAHAELGALRGLHEFLRCFTVGRVTPCAPPWIASEPACRGLPPYLNPTGRAADHSHERSTPSPSLAR